MIKNNSFLINFFLSSSSKLFSSVGLITFNIIIIYFTNKEILGTLTVALSLISFLSIFCKFGLNHAALRLSSIFFEKKDILKINQIILTALILSGLISIIVSVIIFNFEKEIASFFYKDKNIRGVLKIFAIALPIFTFVQLQKSLIKSFKLPALANFSDIGSILFLCSAMVLFFEIIQFNLNVYRISLFFLFSCLLTFSFNNFILFYLVISKLDLNQNNKEGSLLEFNNTFIKSLGDYFSIDFVNYIIVWGSIFICTFFYSASTIASFSSTYWLAYSLLFFPLVLNSIFAPGFAIDSHANKKEKLNINFYKNRNISLLITFPIFIILFIFSENFLYYIFNIENYQFTYVLRILLFNSFLRIIFGPQVLFLNMTDRQNIVRKITVFVSILQIILILLSVIYFDLIVLSVIFLITNFIKHIFLFLELKKYFSFN